MSSHRTNLAVCVESCASSSSSSCRNLNLLRAYFMDMNDTETADVNRVRATRHMQTFPTFRYSTPTVHVHNTV